jgi:hypothetical protein
LLYDVIDQELVFKTKAKGLPHPLYAEEKHLVNLRKTRNKYDGQEVCL